MSDLIEVFDRLKEFNNFSAQNIFKPGAWRPLPAGDGQRLSLGIQTNGRRYQQYSLSFTEPWFRGKPTPLGFSLAFTQILGSTYNFQLTGGKLHNFRANVFYDQRLKWPDNFFNTSTNVGYTFYNNYLRSVYGSIFLSEPQPPKDIQHFIEIIGSVYKTWNSHYSRRSRWCRVGALGLR